jgi:hypothetical protein
MKTTPVITVAMLAALATLSAAAQATGKAAELWETQLTMKSAQHGEMAMPAQRICQPAVTRDPKSMVPQMSQDCPGLTVRQQGDRITWSGQCKQGKAEGEMRFIGTDRMEGRMLMATAQGEFSMQFKGRKLGPCKQEAE